LGACHRLIALLLILFFSGHCNGDPSQITIHVDQPGIRISPTFNGLMTEEISHAYDGGLYAELLRNRAFKDDPASPLAYWKLVPGDGQSTMILDSTQPVPDTVLSNSLRINITKVDPISGTGVANEGFWGIPLTANTLYRVSFYAKSSDTVFVTASIESNDEKITCPSKEFWSLSSNWQRYSGTIQTGDVTPSLDNRFIIRIKGTGSVWLTQMSLFPPTYNQRPNGNRIDLMEMMLAMKPTFLRLPGGNYLDPGHYEWKKSIGPLDQRTGHLGAWDYRSSDGLGLLEFLNWCDDLKVEPVLCVSDGRPWLPGDGDVTPLVQDALDEIEYCTGEAKDSKWAAERAAGGHPQPIALQYVEIGNEDFFDKLEVYNSRFAKFYDAIRAKYPHLKIIATRGDVTSRKPDVIDEHYYRSAADMSGDNHHYDSYDRHGPKIFVGEWASTEGDPTPTLKAALGDAAWLTGLERNSDLVIMEAYAPLLVNVNPGARQWDTNLIGYDALHSFGSPSYWTQVMFAQNTGDVCLPVTKVSAQNKESELSGRVGVGTWDTQADFSDFRVTGPDGKVLYSQDLASEASDFVPQDGSWSTQGKVYTQSASSVAPAEALVGSASWKDYTLTMRARKVAGSEGFLVPFYARDNHNYFWWNIGGWGNTRTTIEQVKDGRKIQFGDSQPVAVETGRWYNIKVELKGRDIRAYLDDKLVNTATAETIESTFTAASRDTRSGDIFLKLVNFSDKPGAMQIHLDGANGIDPTATGQVLTGGLDDVNSIENPTKIKPTPINVEATGKFFSHEFPANSVTVLRFKTH
jgi:alpha-L-arabinofuranosidase